MGETMLAMEGKSHRVSRTLTESTKRTIVSYGVSSSSACSRNDDIKRCLLSSSSVADGELFSAVMRSAMLLVLDIHVYQLRKQGTKTARRWKEKSCIIDKATLGISPQPYGAHLQDDVRSWQGDLHSWKYDLRS
jgi:hypothetical protein